MFGLGNFLTNMPTKAARPDEGQDGAIVTVTMTRAANNRVTVSQPVVYPTWVDKKSDYTIRNLSADLAYVETYIVTLARMQVDGETLDTFTGGRLIDRFERREGCWKIAHRRTIFDWNRDTPTRQGWVGGMFVPGTPGMREGAKGESDPSYERF